VKKINREKIGDLIFYFGLILLVSFLPESKFMMSLSQFIIAFGWVLSGNILSKFKSFFQNKLALAIASIFLIHIIGLIYTEDFHYAFKDLRTKLPLLIFPLLISTGPPITKKGLEKIIFLFCGSVLIATLYCTAVWRGWTYHKIHDIRDISVYISHIRFGLMIAFSVIYLGYFIYQYYKTYPPTVTIIISLIILWFLIFLVILEAITGLCILGITIFFLLCYLIWKKKNLYLRIALFAVLISFPMYLTYYVYQIYKPIKEINLDETKNLKTNSSRGNPYEHDTLLKQRENGHLIYINLNWAELNDAWKLRSKYNFDSPGKSGKTIKYTLVRFLSSKGMRKDADAVKALSDAEIHAVENGITNVDYPQKNSLKTRIYEILWEYDNYRNGGDPNGHSVVQRLEYWKTSLNLIKQHPLIGVGTGDINAAFEKEYAIEHSRLDKEHRLKAHNQYLSITVTFGIIGLLIFLFALIYPLLINRNYADFYYVVFWIFIMLSMFSEDTLETQAGLTFFIFFNTVFLFRKKEGGIGGLKF
jgi:hypothetical protein